MSTQRDDFEPELEAWWEALDRGARDYLLEHGGRDLPVRVETAVRAAGRAAPTLPLWSEDYLVGRHLAPEVDEFVRDRRHDPRR